MADEGQERKVTSTPSIDEKRAWKASVSERDQTIKAKFAQFKEKNNSRREPLQLSQFNPPSETELGRSSLSISVSEHKSKTVNSAMGSRTRHPFSSMADEPSVVAAPRPPFTIQIIPGQKGVVSELAYSKTTGQLVAENLRMSQETLELICQIKNLPTTRDRGQREQPVFQPETEDGVIVIREVPVSDPEVLHLQYVDNSPRVRILQPNKRSSSSSSAAEGEEVSPLSTSDPELLEPKIPPVLRDPQHDDEAASTLDPLVEEDESQSVHNLQPGLSSANHSPKSHLTNPDHAHSALKRSTSHPLFTRLPSETLLSDPVNTGD